MPHSFQKKQLSKNTWTEYQTSDELYEALGDKVASGSMPEFRGRFSIVMDLNINHLNRAKNVVKELKTIAKYPLRSGSRSISNFDSFSKIKYSCSCLANADQPSSSSKQHAAPLQNSHSSNGILRADEKAQANGTKLAEALQASFTRDCKGSVRITVETDSSHPVGVPGQRISILIRH
ncbi:hypothetical protein F5887DRAFT_970829 [Amanita rubescens]|nr:hypothetical protein F5887DRAFT_970829 [Amanita rubescens]